MNSLLLKFKPVCPPADTVLHTCELIYLQTTLLIAQGTDTLSPALTVLWGVKVTSGSDSRRVPSV